MGIDITGLNAILNMIPFCKKKDSCLTLGRQQFCQPIHILKNVLGHKQINIPNDFLKEYSENMLQYLGFKTIHSIDYSKYEGATFEFDLNKPITETVLPHKYDCVIDLGTIEHIFNIPQVFQNIIDILDDDGIFLSVNVNNNFSGHGFWQFSPEVYLRIFQNIYGMELLALYLSEVDTMDTNWVKLKDSSKCTTFREISSIKTLAPVYIIAIARKIQGKHKKLLEYFPQQFSYEYNDWK